MKKMQLQMLGLSINDVLSREQMKKVMGGSGSGSGGDTDPCGTGRSCCKDNSGKTSPFCNYGACPFGYTSVAHSNCGN